MINKARRYTIEEQKILGAYYTPNTLSDLLAFHILSLCKRDKGTEYTVVDPATGDSALLLSFLSLSQKLGIKVRFVGIDIEKCAINQSKRNFSQYNVEQYFVTTDGLYPYKAKTPFIGWNILKKRFFPNGISFFVSNPPWGASKEKYNSLPEDFATAKGQYDIYDIFIETIVNNLSDGGYYGIIVPDSIYSAEHRPIRKLLFNQTTIKRIIRLGEGFFPEVNIAVTLLFGIKKRSNGYKITCSHLSNTLKKRVLSNEINLFEAVKMSECKIPAKHMIDSDYSFLTDEKSSDWSIMKILRNCHSVGQFTTSQRGVELSKKGIVAQCPNCKRWFPEPKGKLTDIVRCQHCNETMVKNSLIFKSIIGEIFTSNSKPIIVGETIYRYNTVARSYITTGINGINYKEKELYTGTKILVRKTGVGITAGIDYNNCLTNQVVYIYKRKEDIHEAITNEVILAILNSRVVTYYIIKKFGSTGWKTHAYLSQADVSSLPFPLMDTEDPHTITLLNRITELVKTYSHGKADTFPQEVDAEIESKVAELYHLNIEHYEIIYKEIENVQKMIPFKRLLLISPTMIFN